MAGLHYGDAPADAEHEPATGEALHGEGKAGGDHRMTDIGVRDGGADPDHLGGSAHRA